IADSNTDTTSALYTAYVSARTGLSASDVGMLQALYGGARSADRSEGATGNGTLATATTLKVPEVAADITTNADVDIFKYKIPDYANKAVTFQVQTAGVSLLTPKVTIMTATGQVVGTNSSTDPLNNTVTVTLNNVKRGTTYYVKVEG